MIKIDGLSVRFGGIKPLDELDAEFAAPICGLIGPNGAGKTTLLNVLSGFVTPIKGTILLNDTALLGLSPRRRVSMGLRRTFQQELVVDELTATENIQAVADHVSGNRASARRQVELGAGVRRPRRPPQYSGPPAQSVRTPHDRDRQDPDRPAKGHPVGRARGRTERGGDRPAPPALGQDSQPRSILSLC